MQDTAGMEKYVAAKAVKCFLGRTKSSPPAVKISKEVT